MTDLNWARDRVDAYVDGHLSSEEQARFESLLERTPELVAEVESLQSLLSLAARLPSQGAAPRDLWPEIESRLEHRGQSARFYPVLLLAAVFLLVVGANTLVAPVDAPSPEWTRELNLAAAELELALDAHDDALSPEAIAVIRTSLKTIDRAIEDIETALQDAPDDPDLSRALLAAHENKLRLLRQFTRVEAG